LEDEISALESVLVYRKNGELDMRYSVNRRYSSLNVWKNPLRRQACAEVAEDIKRDIINCLATGRIPLHSNKVSASTIAARNRLLGLGGDRFFYASGQLIEHLNIYVELSEGA
jgi:hypothetical protein